MLGLNLMTDQEQCGIACRKIVTGDLSAPPVEVEAALTRPAQASLQASQAGQSRRFDNGLSSKQSVGIEDYASAAHFLIPEVDPPERAGRDWWRDNILFPLTHGVKSWGWQDEDARKLYDELSGLCGGDTTNNDREWCAEIGRQCDPGTNPKTGLSVLMHARSHGWSGSVPSSEQDNDRAEDDGEPRRESSYQYARRKLVSSDSQFARDAWDTRRMLWREGDAVWRRLDDAGIREFRDRIAQSGRDPGETAVTDAVQRLADETPYDDVCAMLDEAEAAWDGVHRLGRVGYDLFGIRSELPATFNYALEAIKLLFIAAVRRARKPGCQYDFLIVLEGRQGCGKSSAVRILAETVGAHRFSDAAILNLKDERREVEQISGVWLYECAELVGMKRAETESLKSLITRRVDKARHAYAREMTEQPRRMVFIGTTNDDEYLRDATGNRRFVPVPVGQIDLAQLTALRCQLWGEASTLEKSFGPLVLSPESEQVAEQLRRDRIESHPWDSVIAAAVGAKCREITGSDGQTCLFIATETVLDYIGTMTGVPTARLARDATQQVGRILHRMGWESRRVMIEGDRRRGYVKIG